MSESREMLKQSKKLHAEAALQRANEAVKKFSEALENAKLRVDKAQNMLNKLNATESEQTQVA